MINTGKLLLIVLLISPLYAQSAEQRQEPAWKKKLTYRQKELMKECKPIGRGGRYDYNARDERTLHMKGLVEGAHFTEGVRQGKYGNAGSLEGDLEYVLNKFPNHPEALMVMAKLQASDDYNPRRRNDRKDYLRPSIDCLISRGIQFSPNDPNMHLVNAVVHHQQSRYPEAEKSYLKTVSLAKGNIEAHYNLGLLYVDLNQAEKALEHAKIAYGGGYPLPGLKTRLVKAGVWPTQ